MKLRENIYSVGAIDRDVRIFHGYETPIGTSYNAYLIIDEKVTLIDFVKKPFAQTLLDNIKAVLGDRKLDYIICNHVEPDHSGALPEVIQEYPDAMVYGTPNCEKELRIYYKETKFNFTQVKAGEELCTGKYAFNFIPMPMVHWPDSMASFLTGHPDGGILFSNDALGQHIGTGEIIDTELPLEKLLDRAADYYANIVLPFGMQVGKLLEGVGKLSISMICPSHGVVLTKYIGEMVERYSKWSQNSVDDKSVTIVYDTMWGTTKKLAEQLAKEYEDKGFNVSTICLSEKHHSYAQYKLLESKYIFVGSPTLNNQVMPSVAAFLTYMKGLKPKNRVGKAFGSYGWSGESIGHVNDILSSCGFEMLDMLKVNWNV